MADETPETQETPSVDPPALRLSDDAPHPASAPAKPLEKGGQGKAIVRTRYPVDRFDHSVKGVDPITGTGTEVDRSKVGALLEAAAESGLELEEVENA